jgi:hypothetical protein
MKEITGNNIIGETLFTFARKSDARKFDARCRQRAILLDWLGERTLGIHDFSNIKNKRATVNLAKKSFIEIMKQA